MFSEGGAMMNMAGYFFFIVVLIIFIILVIRSFFRNTEPDKTDDISRMDDLRNESDHMFDTFDEQTKEEQAAETEKPAHEDTGKIRTMRSVYVLRRTLHSRPEMSDFLISEDITEPDNYTE